jgi:hypothetical protein
MTVRLALPEAIVAALGPEPEREALEAILLFLLAEDRVSVAWAGEVLGLDRLAAVRWCTAHGFHYPDSQPKTWPRISATRGDPRGRWGLVCPMSLATSLRWRWLPSTQAPRLP